MTAVNTSGFPAAAVITLLLALACGRSESLPELDLRVFKGKVDLAKQVPGNWDQVCLLTPNTTPVVAADKTGLSILEVSGTPATASDRHNLLFFIRGSQVFAAYQVPRNKVDFDYTQPECFARASAELKTR